MSGCARFLLRLPFENKVFKDNRYMFFIFRALAKKCVSPTEKKTKKQCLVLK